MKITIKRFVLNPISENCYVVSDETHEGFILDCGAFSPTEFAPIEQYVESQGIRLLHALQTHMHFDHVFGLDLLHERYGLLPECHALEEAVYLDNPRLATELCGVSLPMPRVGIGERLEDGQVITVGSMRWEVMHTPGHTLGGLCFYCEREGVLFSGDTLFRGSLGRADTPGGSWAEELASVRSRLLPLPSAVIVLPGHGPSTTIGEEARHNPYLRG